MIVIATPSTTILHLVTAVLAGAMLSPKAVESKSLAIRAMDSKLIDELAQPPITTVTVATRAESSVEVATKVMDTGAAKT